jgi:hypothetical protein
MKTIIISFLLYCLILLACFFIPASFWDQVLEFYESFRRFVAQKVRILPFIGEIYRGEELLLSLSVCEAKAAFGSKMLTNVLPQFKFYTDLIDQLFMVHRQEGVGIKKNISEIRQALIRDVQFEKKILDEILSGFMQFLVIAATTWSFVFLSKNLVSIPLDFMTVVLMLALEGLGAFVFFQVVRHFKVRIFHSFSKAIEELYLFSSLMDAGVPLNDVIQKSGIMFGQLSLHKNFKNLDERLKKVIARMKETGLSPKEETQEIIREIWHMQEVFFLKFTKMVVILKFSILAFFYLPAYFLYLYSIFQFFMEQ